MFEVQLPAGTVEYEDTGGDGPVLVFIHGLLMDGSGWRHVVGKLRTEYRCIVPTWPLGGHRKPMNEDGDLSLLGMAGMVGDFLDALDLRNVTLIQNDWGGAQVLLGTRGSDRVGRLVLTSCEAFDNYPPKPARLIVAAAKVPGGLRTAMALLNSPLGRRGPATWGWMCKRPVPKEVIDSWFRPATVDRDIRRDLAKYLKSVPPRATLREIAQRNAAFTGPVLIAWAVEDKMMPIAHARRLAELYPDARLVEIEDSYTLLAEDQPERLTELIGEFLAATGS
ncbi:alpha/beta fold hydrolase [Nocardia brasiliensis]|uniref:Alpha/beta fold hydrolase n=1 Tax=Nocardia brasiliensis TaxID=37326 RepID=A0A6G9XTQ5_NOCBR|nr:alpha/beta hydrolase [Nocardia brasiliensis]QIS04299.1 alpha/beta fold hydrolase [Nocardia brasiliensis]